MRLHTLAAATFLAACGHAPSNLGYTNGGIISVVAGSAITPLVPRVDNDVRSYAVQSALPNGLSLDSKSGILSGTPTTPQGVQRYVVVATNKNGLDSATLSIVVLGTLPASFAYATPYIVTTAGTAIADDVPSLQVPGAGFTISPALPIGLALDPTSGVIHGAPAQPLALTTYIVTASLSSGDLAHISASAPLTLTVN